ncbi:MAG: signal peptidase II [Thermoleophilia bacterium]|nr:signal peptidase II [Thermoleophilia bacterium]
MGEAAPETPPPRGSRPTVPEVRVGSASDALTPLSVAERRVGANAAEWGALALVAGAAALADQVTKHLVASRVALGEEIRVAGPFSIHHVENSGIAFGLFPTATSAVIVLTSLVVAWMLVFFARSAARHPLLPIGLGLVLGGSISNLLDRIRLGAVTDFLDVDFWPAFNLADTFIVVGVAILLAALIAADRDAAPRARR